MRPFRIAIISLLLTALIPGTSVSGISPDAVIGAGAILMDQASGQILFEKNSREPLYPASTTKVLTALIILEDTPLTDIVTIDAQTPYTDGSRIYLMEGEQVTVEQLLYAMLLPSANDAAVALAKHHSGTVQAFSQVMNQRAKFLGATDSHFMNPNGLPDPEHTTSAHDLALIACKAMEDPTFRKIVSTYAYQIPPTNKQPETRFLHNGNRLLHGTGWRNKIVINNQTMDIKWELADGIKTGYTNAARQCLVASASKDGRRVVAVTLKSEGKDVYKDVRIMLQHGLDDFQNITLTKKGTPMGDLFFSEEKRPLPVMSAEDLTITLPIGSESTAADPELIPNPQLVLPISAGQIVGKAVYQLSDNQSFSVPLKATGPMEAVTLQSSLSLFSVILQDGPAYALKALTLAVSLFLIWRSFATWRRIKKRKRLQQLKNRAERYKRESI